MNKDCLQKSELFLLKQLEDRYNKVFANNNYNENFDFNYDLSCDKSESKTSNNKEQISYSTNGTTAFVAKKNNNTFKIKSNEDLKMKITKCTVLDTTGLPCISEVSFIIFNSNYLIKF